MVQEDVAALVVRHAGSHIVAHLESPTTTMRMRPIWLTSSVLLLAACQGPPGAVGTPGTPGTNGVSGYEVQTTSLPDINIPRGSLPLPIPPCPAGKRVIGGGSQVTSQNQQVRLVGSLPSEDGTTWRVVLQNDGPAVTQGSVTVTKICALAA